MARHLVDTNILIDLLRHAESRAPFLALVAGGAYIACSTVTVAELYAGLRTEHQEETERWLSALEILDVTPPIARLAGSLKLEWSLRGRTLTLPDALIAATAQHHKLALLTANRKDFPMFFPPLAP